MAWPSPVVAGQTATANQYNALVTAVQTWGGDVDAAGYALKNLGSLVINANGFIDVSAGGFSIKGPVNLTGIEGNGLTATAGDAATISLYTKSGQNPALVSSKSVVEVRSADPSRLIRLSAVPGQEEFIQPASGRIRLAGSIDVDTDAVLGGKLTAAAAQFTNAANLTFGNNWQSLGINSVTATGTMTVTGVIFTTQQYLRIGPIVFFEIQMTCNLGGTASNTVFINNLPFTIASPIQTPLICYWYFPGISAFTPGYAYIASTQILLCNAGQTNLPLVNGAIVKVAGAARCS
jgi:hypothetical protein